jgi:hypothetical protein
MRNVGLKIHFVGLKMHFVEIKLHFVGHKLVILSDISKSPILTKNFQFKKFQKKTQFSPRIATQQLQVNIPRKTFFYADGSMIVDVAAFAQQKL